MAVAVGSASELAQDDTYTADAGSDRIVLVVIIADGGGPPAAPTGMTLGGNSLTEAVYEVDNSGATGKKHTGMFWLKESDIQSGAQTLAWTWSSTPGQFDRAVALTLTGVNQTTPVGSTSTDSEDSSTSIAVRATLTVSDGDMVMAHCFVVGAPTTITDPSGYASSLSVNSPTYNSKDQSIVNKAITSGGTESPAFTISIADGGVASFAVVQAAAAGDVLMAQVQM